MNTDNSHQHQIAGNDIAAHNRRESRMAALAPSSTHSPLPWRISTRFGPCSVVAADSYEVAETDGAQLHETIYRPNKHWANTPGAEADRSEEEQEANAALIVRSVNAHAALVAALEEMTRAYIVARDLVPAQLGQKCQSAGIAGGFLSRAEAALALAKGST